MLDFTQIKYTYIAKRFSYTTNVHQSYKILNCSFYFIANDSLLVLFIVINTSKTPYTYNMTIQTQFEQEMG